MSFPKKKAPHNVRVLRDWVQAYADSTDQPVGRVTRAISFMLVALVLDHAKTKEGGPLFLVKGGVSMELRLRFKARTTKDFDTVFRGRFDEWLEALDHALADGVEDFSFSRIKVVGLPYLIAQKLHACTHPPQEGEENLRVHDLMDLLLARDLLEQEDLKRIREACLAIFAGRGTHEWPSDLIVYPSWPATFAKLAAEEDFPIGDVEPAADLVREFMVEIGEATHR